MFKIAIVVFREFLEIALLLGVVIAATRNIKNVFSYIVAGTMMGFCGAGLIAFAASSISDSFDGMGQEIFNISILVSAIIMIAWTVIWMRSHAAQLKQEIKEASEQVSAGNMSGFVLTLIVATCIFREGAEIVLFLYGISLAEVVDLPEFVTAVFLGGFTGAIFGFALYKGLVRLSGRYLFKISSVMLILIAAGLASEVANLLNSGGLVEFLDEPIWNSSSFISDGSFAGKILKIFIGYTAQPSWLQIIFYFGTIASILGLDIIYKKGVLLNGSQEKIG